MHIGLRSVRLRQKIGHLLSALHVPLDRLGRQIPAAFAERLMLGWLLDPRRIL
jgi:hypothetical protein